jgi:phosphotransferase family enzyme
VAAIRLERERPWATVHRVELTEGGYAWFKRCRPLQAFEPRLTGELSRRWPETVTQVVAWDEEHGWLLMRDAGSSMRELGNPRELWLRVLPRYAALQIGETGHAADHVAHGVPDFRLAELPRIYDEMVRLELPVEPEELALLRAFQPELERLCAELSTAGPPETVQHDDLHDVSVYARAGHVRVLDWGDSSIAHPFFSLFVAFQHLGEDLRLRDAYLEPWGRGHEETCSLALRLGAFARSCAWSRQRESLSPADRADFDGRFAEVLRRALRHV